jgi:hypothetical protein
VLAQPLTADSWISARLEQFGEGVCALVLGGASGRYYRPASKTRWLGKDVAWFDPQVLGWRLGYE